MTKTQRTLEVQHPGAHEPSAAQIAAALRSALHADGLVRDGDYKIVGYSIQSGGPSTLVVQVQTKAADKADADSADDRPAGEDQPGT